MDSNQNKTDLKGWRKNKTKQTKEFINDHMWSDRNQNNVKGIVLIEQWSANQNTTE